MKSFKINEKIEIVCEWKKTRTAFKHEATLLINGRESDRTKICYLNRTWESYEFQSVMNRLIERTQELNKEEKEFCNNWLKEDRTDWSELKTIGMVAKLGEVFGTTQKEKNDWKTRMIKAGLGNKGITIPEDWDTLKENEKERRLNLVINEISNCGKNEKEK